MSKTTPKARTTRRTTTTTTRHPYSIKFREEYGRSLSRKEIRLVQAYRGLDAFDAETVSALAARLVVLRAQKGGAR